MDLTGILVQDSAGLSKLKYRSLLALLWQIYSRCFSSLIQDRQYGHR